MFITTACVSLVLAAVLGFSAYGKLTRNRNFVDGIYAVGFPDEHIPLLAAALIAGAAGLLVGLVWWPIGVAAAVGLVAYFIAAVAAHLRINDRDYLPAAGFLVVSLAVLVLRLITI